MVWMIVFINCCWFLGGSVCLEETIIRTMPFNPQSNLFVSNWNGKITINSWHRNAIGIEATKRVRGYPKEETKKILEEIKINLSEDGKGIKIETDIPKTRMGDIGVNYNILIPIEANLVVESKNGGIRIKDIIGDIKAETKNGELTFFNIQGNIEAETKNGRIEYEADTLAEPCHVSLKTKNGSICISIPEIPESSIYADTKSGKTNSDFPIYTNENDLKGKVIIKLETKNGNIF